MRGVHGMLISIVSSLMMVLSPVVNAAAPPTYDGEAEFQTSGSVASAIQDSLEGYILSNEVQQFGYSIYQQGKSYPAAGAEYVSSNPKKDFVSRHIGAHCSPSIQAEANTFGCKAASGIDAEGLKYIEMGDVRFSVLLEPDTYTSSTDLMAQNLIRNLVNPFPDAQIAADLESGKIPNSTKERDKYAKYLADQAVLGVALYSFNEMYGMRVNGDTLGVSTPAEATTSSIMASIESEATKRYLDSAVYVTYLNGITPAITDIEKEMAMMKAFSLYLDFQRFKQNERIEALLAATLAKSVSSGAALGNMFNQ